MSIPVSDTPAFASTHEAFGMLRTVMGYLFAADHAAMAAEAQAECLLALEEMNAVGTATRAKVLSAFTATRGYSADGDYSPRSWLMHRTKITRAAATAHVAWVRRGAAHPLVMAALAARQISESFALEPKDLARLSGRRQLEFDLTVQRGHFEISAERRLRKAHRHFDHHVIVLADEQGMFLDVHYHVKVAGGTAGKSGFTFVAQLEPRAIVYSGRNTHR